MYKHDLSCNEVLYSTTNVNFKSYCICSNFQMTKILQTVRGVFSIIKFRND